MAKRKRRFSSGNPNVRIAKESVDRYKSNLKKLSDKASAEFEEYMLSHHDIKDQIAYAHALIEKYGEASSELACEMYEALADLSNVVLPAAEPARVASYGEVARAIYGERARTRDAKAISSTAGRFVKLASLDTMMKNALRDGAEWAWIPSGDTCPFCLMLASRGWTRASEDAIVNGHADHIHNNCDCTYVVRHSKDVSIEGYDPDALYDEYINAGDTPSERINALRRQHYAANKKYINMQKRAAYARRQTGGKETGGHHYIEKPDWTINDVKAAKAYERYSRVDTSRTIAENTGFSQEQIQQVRSHVFFKKHDLYDGRGRFEPNYDMAVAWKRLEDGNYLPRDITLLQHELLESNLERKYNLTAAEAHSRATAQYNWYGQLMVETKGGGEKDGLL